MADADESALIQEIAERVRGRLLAARMGKEEPCTASAPADCAPSCGECPSVDSCGTASGVRAGAARISPDRIRTSADIAPYIDHTLLKPDATRDEIVRVAEEARKYGFATVCVNSVNVG